MVKIINTRTVSKGRCSEIVCNLRQALFSKPKYRAGTVKLAASPYMETKNPNVLLVDDDEINQLVASTFLRKWNVDVTVAKDGGKALELIKKKDFQLIMMDLHMPEMDGEECTRRIRAMEDPYFRNIPIILFSASGAIDSIQHVRELGMTDFMSKPFRQEELKDKISAYIPLPDAGLRPLHIDFDVHAAGDPAFKTELLHLLIENLEELRRSLDLPLSSTEPSGFQKTSHKVTSAFTILNDPELSALFAQLKSLILTNNFASEDLQAAIRNYRRLAKELVRSMEHEIRSIENNNSAQITRR
jgi:CheY-like chemotaxis protein